MQYRSRTNLSKVFDRAPRTVDKYIKEMQQTGRYPEDCFLKGRGYVLIDEQAFRDFLLYKDRIMDGIPIPPFVRIETPEKYRLRREVR